ncbi:hypothetical protein, partial [Mesorhizobium japonicum]|uniref:hypothetical protein n=1 Tax=Mesorhizobium japonicum TaxID=2066070 RepID=UPI003B5A2172
INLTRAPEGIDTTLLSIPIKVIQALAAPAKNSQGINSQTSSLCVVAQSEKVSNDQHPRYFLR